MSSLRLAALIGSTLIVAGCAGTGRHDAVGGLRPEPARFELAGRIAVKFQGDGYSGSLRWRHVDEHDSIELYSPVGTIYARLSSAPEGASLQMSDGKRFDEPDARALARRVLGWDLPLAQLRFWVFAQPAPGSMPTRTEVDGKGRLAVLDQDGWQVRFLAYAGEGDDLLPQKLELEEPGLKVKLIVSRWGAPASP